MGEYNELGVCGSSMICELVEDIDPVLLLPPSEIGIPNLPTLCVVARVSVLGTSVSRTAERRTSRSLASLSQTDSVSHINVSSSEPWEGPLIDETGLEGALIAGVECSSLVDELLLPAGSKGERPRPVRDSVEMG